MSASQPAVLPRTVLIGAGVAAIAVGVLGRPWLALAAAAVGGFVVAVVVVRHRTRPTGPSIDPFTVGEPWRHFVQSAQRSGRRIHRIIDDIDDGPLRARMTTVAERLDHGLGDAWTIARRGDRLDDAVRRLDTAALTSKLATLQTRQAARPSPEVEAAIASVRLQLDTTERLRAESAKAADRLRLTQTRLDELVARATEVSIGTLDTDLYEHEVDDLVIELEAVRQALEEVDRA